MPRQTYTFKSANRDGIAYRLHGDSMDDSDLWSKCGRSNHALSPHFGEFQTYGDGITQHSSEYPVNAENISDFCISAAAWLLAKETWEAFEDLDLVSQLLYAFEHREIPAKEKLEFALSVQFKAGSKTQYYNVNDRKVSSRESLKHDKRWTAVEEHHNGEPSGAMRVLYPEGRSEYRGVWLWWLTREALVQLHSDNGYGGGYESTEYTVLKNTNKPWQYKTMSKDAIRVLRYALTMYEARYEAHRSMDCFKHNFENQREMAKLEQEEKERAEQEAQAKESQSEKQETTDEAQATG